MTLAQAQQLLKLYEEGYNIYRNTMYVDTSMWIRENEGGVIIYGSHVWAEDFLEIIPVSQIEVRNPVENWEEI